MGFNYSVDQDPRRFSTHAEVKINLRGDETSNGYKLRLEILEKNRLPRYENQEAYRCGGLQIALILKRPINSEDIDLIGTFYQAWLDGMVQRYQEFAKFADIYKFMTKE